MTPKIIRVLGLLLLVTAALWMGGCNTARGMGQDLESAGQAIQNAAD